MTVEILESSESKPLDDFSDFSDFKLDSFNGLDSRRRLESKLEEYRLRRELSEYGYEH
ncbi:MAG: hypothetical protein ACI93R_001190 [Flavobacteriales bacterium]|jgi:hypothetical protein